MKIEIKNLKHSEFASDETDCFEATVYINGKRAFLARNQGFGGCNDYHPLKATAGEQNNVWNQVTEVNDYLKTLPPVITDLKNDDGTFWEYQKDLDSVISDLVNDELSAKQLKKIMRKITVLTDEGSICTYPAKYKPTTEAFEQIERHKGIKVVLNRLPFDEALKIFRAAT